MNFKALYKHKSSMKLSLLGTSMLTLSVQVSPASTYVLLCLTFSCVLLTFSHASINIDFTYERDDGLVRSWPDHVLTNSHCVSNISSVTCLHSPDNFSDHVPLCFKLSVSVTHLECRDSLGLKDSNHSDSVDWLRIDPISIERYQNHIQSCLPVLSDELLKCPHPNCKSHQSTIDSICEKFFLVLVPCWSATSTTFQ